MYKKLRKWKEKLALSLFNFRVKLRNSTIGILKFEKKIEYTIISSFYLKKKKYNTLKVLSNSDEIRNNSKTQNKFQKTFLIYIS